MTDKVHKIREEVARIQLYSQSEVLKQILDFIDSLQEEPASEDKITISKEWFEHCKKSWYNEGYIDGKYNRDRQFEESVSEDLEEASEKCIKELIPEAELNSATPFALEYVVKLLHETFKAGAKWQEKQDQSTIELAEDHAMLAGMNKMEQQMMTKAVDGIARPYDNEIWCILDSFNLEDGDEVKVIVIKKKLNYEQGREIYKGLHKQLL